MIFLAVWKTYVLHMLCILTAWNLILTIWTMPLSITYILYWHTVISRTLDIIFGAIHPCCVIYWRNKDIQLNSNSLLTFLPWTNKTNLSIPFGINNFIPVIYDHFYNIDFFLVLWYYTLAELIHSSHQHEWIWATPQPQMNEWKKIVQRTIWL